MQLLFTATFVLFAFAYPQTHLSGDAFWSNFYATDLSTSADIVAAADGEVLLRHDNLKPNLDLGFWLSDGRIAVASLPEESATTSITVQGIEQEYIVDFSEPQQSRIARYGQVHRYIHPGFLQDPQYLALRKTAGTFSILPADLSDSLCQSAPIPVNLPDARVQISFSGSYTQGQQEQVIAAVRDVLHDTPIIIVQSGGTIRVAIEKREGDADAISIAPEGPSGKYLGCSFAEQLSRIAFTRFATQNSPTTGTSMAFSATVTTTSGSRVSPEQIGKALGLAIAQVYG